ncbi:MAG: transcription-repair coupling factor, partial [Clostridia bacterium]|nr:transcription-repair coupling factor [Clostridia bacterium]
MNLLLDAVRREKEYTAILENYRMQTHERTPYPMLVTGLSEGAREAFYAALVCDLRKLSPNIPVLCILPDEKELLKMESALADTGLRVANYPLRDFVFHNIVSSREYEQQRIGVLCAVRRNTCDVVLTVPDAALQYTIPKAALDASAFTIDAAEEYDLGNLTDRLSASGYTRCDLVDGVGEYAVRGGILDIFPAGAQTPVRMEFFGDEIDSMAQFDALSQRRLDNCETCFIPPAKEILLSDEAKKALRALISAQKKKCTKSAGTEALEKELEALDSGVEPGFLDKYIAFLYPQKETLLDYFRNEETGRVCAPVILQDSPAVKERLTAWEFHTREAISSLLEDSAISAKYAEYTLWQADFEDFVGRTQTVMCETFSAGSRKLSGIFTFRTRQTVSYADSFETLLEDIRHYTAEHFRILLLADNEFSADNLQKTLYDENITAHRLKAADAGADALTPEVPSIFVCGPDDRTAGFELTESRFCALSTVPGSEHNAYARALARSSKKTKRKRSSAETILSYADLTVGDYVVHVNHGIGQYMGTETIRGVDGATRDYVKIKYADNAAIFLPCDQLDMISKYIGAHSDDGLVKLSKMGGTDWTKTKARVKAAAKNMAKELTQLYAARMRRPGFAFSADDELQRSFESVFPYEETDSQLRAVEEIKADMMRPSPMDRLLCGDVGYGKTEVALRAAMKAVENGKQVAILVPTTILALQHYQTILSRFRGLPVHAEILSRFRTPMQQENILRKLRRGEIDIIVGTHRLVSKDVAFKDLGLVIIDEEQRFGVAHKEKLKTLAENVDCLTLTATPIPRTLNMAMSGIRDMSILDEAPGDRVPIQTYVLEYDALILGEALKKELRRGGQVFWLHNRVEDIDQCAGRVQEMVPDAVIAVAHGKMDKEDISAIWQRLLSGEVDILVSTTIIETGIDIPNANTLVIENADRMGLSQLHQIRGRIGRSSRRAYAYFTYPPRLLTEIATKRLQAIKEYTEFGSGFKIAMRDLEIRGAGNILGAEQHGHMESVGYDLYIRILNEAILEEKGEALPQKVETVIDIPVDAYLPDRYIRSGAQRIELYKKIAGIDTPEDISDILDELSDRFGEPPKAAQNLVRIAYLRALASRCRIERVTSKENMVSFYPVDFNGEAWLECAKSLMVGVKEPEPKQVSAPKPIPGKIKGVATPVPGAKPLPQAGKYTPLARAAALAAAGRAAAEQPKKPAPIPGGAAIRLTVAGGKTPCIQAKIPKTD